MLIDWFTVAAQAANFLILVWLLKRFLYKPVLAAIDAREIKIAAELKDAAAKKVEAEAERDAFRAKNEAFETQRNEFLRKAVDDANAERQRLLDAARKDSEALRSKLSDAVKSERDELNREIVTLTQQEVFALAGKALADLAGTQLEERMAEVFIRRLRDIPDEQKARLAAAPRTSATLAVVRSAFDLPAITRAAIETAVKECLGADAKPTFQRTPELISGIELTVDGRRIAWSITDYLASLAQNVTTLLVPKADATSVPPPTDAKDAA